MNILEAIVFDCDGIILESAELKSEAFFRLGALFGPIIQKRFYEYHLRNSGVSRYTKFAWLYRTQLGRDITLEESRALGNLFTNYCTEAVRNAPLVPGFMETLDWLNGRLPLFVASGTPHEELNAILHERGLSGNFKCVLGSPPEKSELLSQILKNNKLEPSLVLMVGDGETDFKAAMENGVTFYGRGALFAARRVPWSADLHGLRTYLEQCYRYLAT